MSVKGRQLRFLAVLVVITAVIIIVLLPGQSQCVRMPGEYDCSPDTPGAFTTARVVTGTLGFVVALVLWFVSSILDAE